MAVRFLQENPVPRKEKGAPVSRCAFAFPLRCGHFCTVLLLRTASSNSQSPIRSSSSHCQKSPLKPMLPATESKSRISRWACRSSRHARKLTGIPGVIGRDGPQRRRAPWLGVGARSCSTFYCISVSFAMNASRRILSCNITIYGNCQPRHG